MKTDTILCGTCKHADTPISGHPCCSCDGVKYFEIEYLISCGNCVHSDSDILGSICGPCVAYKNFEKKQ